MLVIFTFYVQLFEQFIFHVNFIEYLLHKLAKLQFEPLGWPILSVPKHSAKVISLTQTFFGLLTVENLSHIVSFYSVLLLKMYKHYLIFFVNQINQHNFFFFCHFEEICEMCRIVHLVYIVYMVYMLPVKKLRTF